jgi:hypothetical protein
MMIRMIVINSPIIGRLLVPVGLGRFIGPHIGLQIRRRAASARVNRGGSQGPTASV